MSSDIYVWESALGWKVVEAWVDASGSPYNSYVILKDGLEYADAIGFARCLRRTFFGEGL